MSPAAQRLADDLATSALALEAMLANGDDVRSLLVMSLRKKVRVLAADYQEAVKAPLKRSGK